MDIIEISPPKKLVFTVPQDLIRVITITNLTLRSLYIKIFVSHEYQLSLSRKNVLMQAFQELKLQVTFNYNQQILHHGQAKLRIYYYELEDEMNQQEIEKSMFGQNNKIQYEQISIYFDIDSQFRMLHYQLILDEERKFQRINSEIDNKCYLMRRVYSHSNKFSKSQDSEKLKDQIFNYLQQMSSVNSIQQCLKNQTFLIEFKQNEDNLCTFITFIVGNSTYIYSISKIIGYGKKNEIPTLVNIDSDQQLKPNRIISNNNPKEQHVLQKCQKNEISQKISAEVIIPQESVISENKKKQILTKQSFILKRENDKIRHKRKNKSQQKIQQHSSEDEEQSYARRQLQNIKLFEPLPFAPPPPIKIRHQIKINETNIDLTEKVLAVLTQIKQNCNLIYVVVRDCVRIFMLEDSSFRRIIKFDPIDKDNITMPCPIDIYKDQLIFGNQSYLFWVNLQTGYNQWKYVQRKYIYSLAVIQQLSLVALGGKNFSKLSYFGKQTSRSNIKLYSCSSSDKHDHLFTYDIPGNNVGHVINMAYISTPPTGTKLLLVHTISPETKSSFYFFRVKAFNKIQVFGHLQLEDLGILNLLKFKYNRETNRVVCMEALGDTQMDTFKKLKIKCQYEKVEVSTQGFKFPLKRFLSYHLGGSKEGICKEWMSFVEDNGSIFHVYDFEQNKLDTFELGKGQIKQIFSFYNQKYLVICSDNVVKIREKIEIQIKQ